MNVQVLVQSMHFRKQSFALFVTLPFFYHLYCKGEEERTVNYIDSQLVFSQLDAKDSTDVISQLADALYKQGYVNADYKQAVLDREKVYPTGLPSDDICVAVPHTDVKYVKKPAIVFASLMMLALICLLANSWPSIN